MILPATTLSILVQVPMKLWYLKVKCTFILKLIFIEQNYSFTQNTGHILISSGCSNRGQGPGKIWTAMPCCPLAPSEIITGIPKIAWWERRCTKSWLSVPYAKWVVWASNFLYPETQNKWRELIMLLQVTDFIHTLLIVPFLTRI